MKSRIKTRGYYRKSERLSGFVGLGGSMVLCLWLMVLGQGINLNKQKVEAKEYNKPVVVVADLNLNETQDILFKIIQAFPEKSLVAQAIAKAESGLNPSREGIH